MTEPALIGSNILAKNLHTIFRGDETMRAFLLAAIAAAVLAVGTAYVLDSIQKTTEVAYVGSGASVSTN